MKRTTRSKYRKPIAFVRGTDHGVMFGIYVKTMRTIAKIKRECRVIDLVWI